MPKTQAAAQEAVIDLCDEDQPETAAEAYAAEMEREYANAKKRRRKNPRMQPLASAALMDAVSVDDDDDDALANVPSDSLTLYRRFLGPLRFDFVASLGAHAFQSTQQNPGLKPSKIYKELLEYKLNLPIELSSSIFCRALESRIDLIRFMITGPDETPYENGCFFFDVLLHDYPAQSPKVQFLTTGNGRVRFNPNLYNCGKVCLSLLGTWSGPGWIKNKSTLLQVLVSIQGLILVPDPYFNEPSYDRHRNSGTHKVASEAYNKNIRRYTLEHAINGYLEPLVNNKGVYYPEFREVLTRHFCARADVIRNQTNEWANRDLTLRSLAGRICVNLDRLEQQFDLEQQRLQEMLQQQKPPPASTVEDAIVID